MKDNIEERIYEEARYILEKKGTVRSLAKIFNVSKSTVHFDLSKRLRKLDYNLFKKVDSILKFNLSQRHIRGGIATKKKYEEEKNLNKK